MKDLFWATQAALGVLFVGLRLTGFIDWHWALVTAPFWFCQSIIWGTVAVLDVVLWCIETPEQRRLRKNREELARLLGVKNQ